MQTGEDSHRTKGLLRLTMACNARCPFCNVPVEDYTPATPPESELWAALQAFEGAKTLTISGGEPTLYPQRLITLITRARAQGARFIELQTNALLLSPELVGRLVDAGLSSAFVSLLSHQPALHDQLAGLDGAWSRCVAGIEALLAAGVSVTLNPVTAASTSRLLPDYVDFVAAHLPGVSLISVSAVQPHGRAAHHPELLPNYAELGPAVVAARARAVVHGIPLINPYCGLPACVGWADDLGRSVEAWEGQRGGFRDTPGLENRGNKSYGPPCEGCALRPWCGGAWHAYWRLHGGAGLASPERLSTPWERHHDSALQRTVDLRQRPDLRGVEAGPPSHPTVWWWVSELDPNGLDALHCDVLALELSAAELQRPSPTLRALRRLQTRSGPRVHLGLRGSEPHALRHAVGLASALALASVTPLSPLPEPLRRQLRALHPDLRGPHA